MPNIWVWPVEGNTLVWYRHPHYDTYASIWARSIARESSWALANKTSRRIRAVAITIVATWRAAFIDI